MERSPLLAALVLGLVGVFVAPRFEPTTEFSPVLVFVVCALGALGGLWIVSYALELE